MNIIFDIFLNNPALVDEIEKSSELNEVFQEMYSFVQGRLQPLADKINKEERDEPEKLMGTIIFLESSPEDPGKFIGFHGYSQQLSELMVNSFVENDITFIREKLKNIT